MIDSPWVVRILRFQAGDPSLAVLEKGTEKSIRGSREPVRGRILWGGESVLATSFTH